MSKGKKNAKVSSDASGGWDEALVKDEVADVSVHCNSYIFAIFPFITEQLELLFATCCTTTSICGRPCADIKASY